jgi:hypothetical protein
MRRGIGVLGLCLACTPAPASMDCPITPAQPAEPTVPAIAPIEYEDVTRDPLDASQHDWLQLWAHLERKLDLPGGRLVTHQPTTSEDAWQALCQATCRNCRDPCPRRGPWFIVHDAPDELVYGDDGQVTGWNSRKVARVVVPDAELRFSEPLAQWSTDDLPSDCPAPELLDGRVVEHRDVLWIELELSMPRPVAPCPESEAPYDRKELPPDPGYLCGSCPAITESCTVLLDAQSLTILESTCP